jgi:uncharacterized protein (UPF0335 family)
MNILDETLNYYANQMLTGFNKTIVKKLYNVIREDDKKKDDINTINELFRSAYTEDKESDKKE